MTKENTVGRSEWRAFWNGFLDGLALMPLWRALAAWHRRAERGKA